MISHGTLGARAGLALGLALLLTLPGCPSSVARRRTMDAKEAAMRTTACEHGFRHDPMKFVEGDRGLQGAMVRSFVFEAPKPGDKELIQAEVEKILGKQLPDGRLSDDPKHSYQFTAEALARLAEMGCKADRPEVQKALAAVLGKPKPNQADPYGIYDVRAFCLLGLAATPPYRDIVRKGIEGVMAREKEWSDIWEGCPWTPIEHLITLWRGREAVEVEPCVAKALKWLGEGINAAGCISYKDPWGFVRLASVIDHPLAKRILEKEIPVILRGQRADGGWGDRSLFVFRALKTHGLLEPLRKKPPLPPDWRIVKAIPAPEDGCFGLAWDGERLWTRCGKASEAAAVSPADGKVVRRLELSAKGAFGLAAWDGALAVTDNKAKKLLRVNVETGKVEREIALDKMEWINGVTAVGGKLAIGDGFLGVAMLYDPADPSNPQSCVLGGPIPVDLATEGDAVWHLDAWAPALIKSGLDRHGHLLDWGEKPFDGRCDGIAHDGTRLWALDARGKRICAIEKAATRPRLEKTADGACIRGLEAMDWGGSFFTRQESFMACFTEVLRCAGRETTYAEVMGLSGAAFKLTTGSDNWCPSQAISDVGADCTERAVRLLGFEREIIDLDETKHPGAKAKARAAIVESINRGLPVLYMDGERSLVVGYRDGGKAFICKPYAGGNPGYAEQSTLKGMLEEAWFVEVLRRKGEPAPRRQALLDSLVNAVAVAKTINPKLPTGFHAWNKWAQKLDKPPEKPNLHGHAYDYSILLTSRQAAAAWLRQIADELKPEAAVLLRQAADRHAAIGKRLWDGRDLVKHPWDKSWTAENRAAEARIFRDCRSDEVAAIKLIDQALQAEGVNAAVATAKAQMPSDAAHPQKLLDKAVAAFDHMQKRIASHENWGEGMYPYPQPCVYLQMHWVEMQTAGWDVDYDTLVATSSASALFAYEPKEFMPKCANQNIGMDGRIADATGFGYEWVTFNGAEDAWRILKETVDSGRAAKGWDWEGCAFCGYQEADKPEDRRVYAIADGPATISAWWTWKDFNDWLDRITKWKQNCFGRYTKRVAVKPEREIALRVMQDLVAWSTDPPEVCTKRFPKATFGLAGIERYAADCADVKASPDWVMCHGINPQWTVRHSTAVYLGRVAEGKLFDAKAREAIAKAAAEYKAAAEAWHKAYGLLGHGATKEQRREPARREAAAKLIREALAHEKAGIAALRLALGAEVR